MDEKHTREINKLLPTDLIKCQLCQTLKPATEEEFYLRLAQGRKPGRYHEWCRSCTKIRNKTEYRDSEGRRRFPPLSEVKKLVLDEGTLGPTLNRGGHKGWKPSEVAYTDEELKALRSIKEKQAEALSLRQGFVYLIIEDGDEFCKIGYSTQSDARIGDLQTGNPRLLTLYAVKEGTKEDEKQLHLTYLEHNTYGEWFYLIPDMLLEFQDAKLRSAASS